MFAVALAAAVIWGIGAAMGTPHRQRWTLLGLLYVAVLLAHLVFPAQHPLRLATGETAAPWLMLGGLVVLVLAYRRGLRWLRTRAEGQAEDRAADGPKPATFSDTELNRYARHIVLREVGGPGQKKLKEAKVLVVGAGGLGSPALLYLAAAGVGTIGVVDDDAVDNSNLQRQDPSGRRHRHAQGAFRRRSHARAKSICDRTPLSTATVRGRRGRLDCGL